MPSDTTTATPTETVVKRDPIAQGAHILKSYLRAVNIGFAAGSSPGEVIINKKDGGILKVRVSEPGLYAGKNYNIVVSSDFELVIDPKEISSYDIDKAMAAFWTATKAAGHGTPLPVDRGPRQPKGRVSYHDNFEDVYLRHTIFERSPNLPDSELEPYMPTIRSAARRAHFRWNSVFLPMGYDVDDLVNVGRVYTTSFLHNYAYSEDRTDNIKLLTTYLNQRFGEWAKIAYKKAVNSTCLPSMVKSDTVETDDGEVSYIETYAEADGSAPDEEYESGEYVLRVRKENGDVAESKMSVRPSKMLGVDIYLDGSLLPKSQADALRAAIDSGRIQVSPVPSDAPVADPDEGALDRRLKARAELYSKLNAMPREKRELALSYAALSRDYDPDARREARRLAEELACPKCEKKVPSGAMCMSCGVEARPRYGIDYMAFREKLRAEGHSMAEALTAPIPESEVRARQNRAEVSNTAPLADSKPEDVVIEPMTPAPGKSKEEIKAMAQKLADDFMATLPDTLECPSCEKIRPKHEFGIRVPRDKKTGLPSRAVRQSYCKPCRKT